MIIDSKMLQQFLAETRQEFKRILAYWDKYTIDNRRGGFHGRVMYNNQPVLDAPRSVVVTSRILWTYSLAYNFLHNHKHKATAERAYHYLVNHFFDTNFGGVYWSVTADGKPLETKKHIYGHSFALYGLSEYYAATKFQPALEHAIGLFKIIENQSFDKEKGGYWEAFDEVWQPVDDMILTKKPFGKTMNTHLHLLEAYTNLYKIWPDGLLRERIIHQLGLFKNHIIDPATHRMRMFCDADWKPSNNVISYGHDIEASWLLFETAEAMKDRALHDDFEHIAVKMAEAATTGLGEDGALNYELNPDTNHLETNRSWWVVAEQMVGYLNVYQLSKEEHYLEKSFKTWDFIKKYQIDRANGEWHATVKADHTIPKTDKVHFWKGPYHAARACYEVTTRIDKLLNLKER
jgi:cellobiose epimerase